MNAQAIIKAIQAAAQLAESLAPLVSEARSVLTTEDQGEVNAALARLGAANDALHERVQDKLAKAAQAG